MEGMAHASSCVLGIGVRRNRGSRGRLQTFRVVRDITGGSGAGLAVKGEEGQYCRS